MPFCQDIKNERRKCADKGINTASCLCLNLC
jgi:hypothetical protein